MVVRVTRKDGPLPWVEFERGDVVISSARQGTPPCDQARLRAKEARAAILSAEFELAHPLAILTDAPAWLADVIRADAPARLGAAVTIYDCVRWRGILADGRRFVVIHASPAALAKQGRASFSGAVAWPRPGGCAADVEAGLAQLKASVERARLVFNARRIGNEGEAA